MSDIKKRIERERLEAALTDEFIDSLSIVTLVQGVLEDGQPYYAYALIPKDRYRAFKQAEAQGNYDVRDYGEVLFHGEGLLPPREIAEEMKQRYGADPNFEQNLHRMAQAMDADMPHNDTDRPAPSKD